MSKLRVTLHGQVLSELNLEPGQEYFAGRGSQCQILLSHDRGISRQHVKIFHDGSIWNAQLISKYGGMIFEGQTVDLVQLTGDVQFSVPPYEFHFSIAEEPQRQSPAKVVVEQDDSSDDDLIEIAAPVPSPLEPLEPLEAEPVPADGEHKGHEMSAGDELEISHAGQQQFGAAAHADAMGNMDMTVVAPAQLVPYLKIINRKAHTEEILKLDGDSWTLGRHPKCEIVVEDSAISRKHFTITKTAEGFSLKDLGSSNRIRVNRIKLESGDTRIIQSGDVIRIRHIDIHFEIHDSAFSNKLAVVPVHVIEPADDPDFQSGSYRDLQNQPMIHDSNGNPSVLRIPPPNEKAGGLKLSRKSQIFLAIGALVIIYGLFFDTPQKSSDTGPGAKDSSSISEYDKMTPDKKKEIVDVFNLAQNYYVQRKYVLCLSQVEKLHSMVPFHGNSKELESLCKQAQELEQIEADRRRKEEARAEAENRIRQTVEECKVKITKSTTMAELNACLAPAVELDPQNGLITDLQATVLMQENEARDQQNKALEFARRRDEGRRVYAQAQRYLKSGKLKSALSTYKSFVSGRYPGLNQEEDEAQRNIASIAKTIEEQIQHQVSRCRSAKESGNLKEAIIACDRVLKEHPGHSDAKSVREQAYAQLQREMKALYDDSRIEESLGNIEAAKEKWKKITEKSVPEDTYYQRAKRSLKKYGL